MCVQCYGKEWRAANAEKLVAQRREWKAAHPEKARELRRAWWTKTYGVWHSMIQRCINPNQRSWKYYGGRGIAVCERWHTFANFLDDMGEKPEGRSIDRIDNDGDYEPSNCRWATQSEQNANRRKLKAIEQEGEPA